MQKWPGMWPKARTRGFGCESQGMVTDSPKAQKKSSKLTQKSKTRIILSELQSESWGTAIPKQNHSRSFKIIHQNLSFWGTASLQRPRHKISKWFFKSLFYIRLQNIIKTLVLQLVQIHPILIPSLQTWVHYWLFLCFQVQLYITHTKPSTQGAMCHLHHLSENGLSRLPMF